MRFSSFLVTSFICLTVSLCRRITAKTANKSTFGWLISSVKKGEGVVSYLEDKPYKVFFSTGNTLAIFGYFCLILMRRRLMAGSSVFINNYKLHSLEKTTHIYPSPGGSDKDVAFLKKFIQVSFSARDNRSQNASAEEALRC